MFPAKPSAHQSAPTARHQRQTLRAALDRLTLGMRELEEQLPLPTDRRVRDTTPSRQKATALRVDIEEFNRRLTQISQQFKAMNSVKE